MKIGELGFYSRISIQIFSATKINAVNGVSTKPHKHKQSATPPPTPFPPPPPSGPSLTDCRY